MKVEYDPAKNERNLSQRGISFDAAIGFDFGSALVEEDTRSDYPEQRWVAIGLIGDRVHVLCFTQIPGGIRVISLRKANKREVKFYEST